MYQIEINGKILELPNYTMSVMEEIEKVEASTNSASKSMKSKLQTMYDFIVKFVGKEAVEEAIGVIDKADLNDINIAYLSILREYNKPLNEFELNQGKEDIKAFNDSDLQKLGDTISKFENMAKQVQGQTTRKFHK